MRKSILFLFLILALALSACGSLTPPAAATPAGSTEAAQQAAPVGTPAESSATDAALANPTVAGTPTKPECRVDTSAQASLKNETLLPKIGTTDWTKGPDDAYVHIIEYSDFQ
jgi:hypothetical protein